MRRFAVVLLAFALVLAPTMASAHAAKKKYVVTLTAPSTGEVGSALALSGTVSGPLANGQRVLVQQLAGSTWMTIARAKVHKGKWHTSVVPTSAGPASYRAVKPKSAKRKLGVSSTRSVTVYRWLWLAQQPAYYSDSMFDDVDSNVAGVRHAHSLVANENLAAYKLGGLCDSAQAGFAIDDQTADPAATADYFFGVPPFPLSPTLTPMTKGTLSSASLATSGAQYLVVQVTNASGTGTVLTAVTSPRAHCAADALPQPTYAELSAML